MSTDQEAVRELLGPLADLPSPPSPDDRDEAGEATGGIIPGTGRRAEDHQPSPPGQHHEPGQ
ncbi:MAG TPA: hypothetical protein VHG93_19830 [Longimicrobium sp.]|nr:hypothetical protein [Longimicrobium sp.]